MIRWLQSLGRRLLQSWDAVYRVLVIAGVGVVAVLSLQAYGTMLAKHRLFDAVTDAAYTDVRDPGLIRDATLYRPIIDHTGDVGRSPRSYLVLVTAKDCIECELAAETWTKAVERIQEKAATEVWMVHAGDAASGASAALTDRLVQLGIPHRQLAIVDQVSFYHRTGILVTPTSVVYAESGRACVGAGIPSSELIAACLDVLNEAPRARAFVRADTPGAQPLPGLLPVGDEGGPKASESASGQQASAPAAPEQACETLGDANLNVTLETLNGKSVSLGSYAADIVIIGLVAPWAPPGRTQAVALGDVFAAYDRKRVAVVAVVDTPARTAQLDLFIKDNHIEYPVLLTGAQTGFAAAYPASRLPTV